MSKTKYENREAWLAAAVGLMTPLFKSKGYTVPALRVSCGWPSVKGLSQKKRRIGECWSPLASTDKVPQIFISPWLKDVATNNGVLGVLVHEVVHAAVGVEHGHKGPFKKCATGLGLTGKMTATVVGPELLPTIESWAKSLGEYPHGKLDLNRRPVKKQTTRLVKCECGECGYTVRTTRKWLDEVGAPICPHNKKAMKFTLPDELETDDGGDE